MNDLVPFSVIRGWIARCFYCSIIYINWCKKREDDDE